MKNKKCKNCDGCPRPKPGGASDIYGNQLVNWLKDNTSVDGLRALKNASLTHFGHGEALDPTSYGWRILAYALAQKIGRLKDDIAKLAKREE